MSSRERVAVVLAGGEGKRMRSEKPKVLSEVMFRPMISWVLDACECAKIKHICVVTGYESEQLEAYLGGRYETVLQQERKGTGHAVMMAQSYLSRFSNADVLILYGDAPFIEAQTITAAWERHAQEENSVTVVTAEVEDPTGYGRIVRAGAEIASIVEQKDATEAEKSIREINSGIYWFRGEDLLETLPQLQNNNSQGEYYLTDTISLLIAAGKRAGIYQAENADSILGANDRKGLLMLNEIAKRKIIEKHLEAGVEFLSADGVLIDPDVTIGAGTVIYPNTILKGNTSVGKECVLSNGCVIENCSVGDRARLNAIQAYDSTIGHDVSIGPYTHIRPGTKIHPHVKIGDFVEIKNSEIGEYTAVSHLTYVGDSDVGKNVNFGCGVVTVNYDGTKKSRTTIGDNAFIGCNTNLVAPVKLGDMVYTAAGTTVTKDVPDGALAIGRAPTVIKEGYATKKLKDFAKKHEKETSK